MIPIVVLASGRGSNFESIQSQIAEGQLKADIRAVISDQPSALVLGKARKWGIPDRVIPFPDAKNGASLADRRSEHEYKLLKELEKIKPKFLILAGYRRIITPILIDAFRCDKGYSRMVNIHPSLLPAFPGLGSYAQAFRYGAHLAGVTIHLVEPEVDAGPICAQAAFSITDCQSEQEVEERGLAVEHRLLPQSLSWILPEKFKIEVRPGGRRLCLPELK
jgi:phosphoribosylglycinamide formyltransferase-1